MRSFRTILTLLLALAWVPLTAHCRIENLTGLQLLRCSTTEAGAPEGDEHCAGAGCCPWESGQCQLAQPRPLIAAPLLVLAPVVAVPLVADETTVTAAGYSAGESPPGFPKPWQFSLRAALQVRAPSLAS